MKSEICLIEKKKTRLLAQTGLYLKPLSSCIANDLTPLNISFFPYRVEVAIVIHHGRYLGWNETSYIRSLTPSLVLVHAQKKVLLFPFLPIEPRHSTKKIKMQKVEKRKNSFLKRGGQEGRDWQDNLSEMSSCHQWVRQSNVAAAKTNNDKGLLSCVSLYASLGLIIFYGLLTDSSNWRNYVGG